METYPNPANEITCVKFETGVATPVTLILSDIQGNIVFEQRSNVAVGTHKIELPVQLLPAGIYNYTIIVNNASVSKKINIAH